MKIDIYIYEDCCICFVKGGQPASGKNLHAMVWPAGTAKNGFKNTKNDWMSIQKEALHSYHHTGIRLSFWSSILGVEIKCIHNMR